MSSIIRRSSVITFYSFKGGVGRTMALANIAALLARKKRVLVVDWDLEAPGLDRYFAGRIARPAKKGLLDLLDGANENPDRPPDWRDAVSTVELPQRLDLIDAGERGSSYAGRLERLDWSRFFSERRGGAFIERLRNEWRDEYDFTLIDSRTGYTDMGGVCTILLPDMLVVVFTANEQSLCGVEEAIEKAQAGRQRLDVDRSPLLVVPLPSRFDGRVEVEEAERWTEEFSRRLRKYYDGWLPRGSNYRLAVEQSRVPHVPFYSFGEKLPVLEQSLTDPEGMGRAYDRVAGLLECELRDADVQLLGGRTDSAGHRGTEGLDDLTKQLERRIERQQQLIRRRRAIVSVASVASFALAAAVVAGLLLETTSSSTQWRFSIGIIVAALLQLVFVFPSFRERMSSSSEELPMLDEALAELRIARELERDDSVSWRQSYESATSKLRSVESGSRKADSSADR